MKLQFKQKWLLSTLLLTALGSQYFFSHQSMPEGKVDMSSLGQQYTMSTEISQDPLVIAAVNSALSAAATATTNAEMALRDAEKQRQKIRDAYAMMKGDAYKIVDQATEAAMKASELSATAKKQAQLAGRVAKRENKFQLAADAKLKAAEADVASAEAVVYIAESKYEMKWMQKVIFDTPEYREVSTAREKLTEARLALSKVRSATEAAAICPTCTDVTSYGDFQQIMEHLNPDDCSTLDQEDRRTCRDRIARKRSYEHTDQLDELQASRNERNNLRAFRAESSFVNSVDRLEQRCKDAGPDRLACFSVEFSALLRQNAGADLPPSEVQNVFNRNIKPYLAGQLANPMTHASALGIIQNLTTGIPQEYNFVNTGTHSAIMDYQKAQAVAAHKGSMLDRTNLFNNLSNIGNVLSSSSDTVTNQFYTGTYVPSIRSLFPTNTAATISLAGIADTTGVAQLSNGQLTGGQIVGTGRSGIVRGGTTGAQNLTLPATKLGTDQSINFGTIQTGQRGGRGSY